jgi:hypothetical protein
VLHNYDTKGASNRQGERQISSCFALRALGFFFFFFFGGGGGGVGVLGGGWLGGVWGFWLEGVSGFRFVGLGLECLGFFARFGASCVCCWCIQGRLLLLINYYS